MDENMHDNIVHIHYINYEHRYISCPILVNRIHDAASTILQG